MFHCSIFNGDTILLHSGNFRRWSLLIGNRSAGVNPLKAIPYPFFGLGFLSARTYLFPHILHHHDALPHGGPKSSGAKDCGVKLLAQSKLSSALSLRHRAKETSHMVCVTSEKPLHLAESVTTP